MNSLHKIKETALSGLVTVALFACSHNPPNIQEYPETASAPEEVKKLESDLGNAVSRQVNVLSPKNYSKASDSLSSAKSKLDSQKDAKDVLHEVAKGRAYLNLANTSAGLSKSNMEDVVSAREKAMSAGAHQFFAKDFKEADEDLRDVTEDVENNKLSAVEKNRSKLQATYLELELKAIKHSSIGSAKATIDEAIKEGAKDYAPRTLAIAEKNVKDTEAFIIANRYDTAAIKQRSEATVASANHLLKITHDSKANKKTSPEELALQMDSKTDQLEETQERLNSAKAGSSSLAATNAKLKAEQDFNKTYDQAQAAFAKDEAEVYKRGDTLLIRLKGIEFPKDQAVLKEGDFELLSKVQDVIKTFGKSEVVIQGHTDSRGGKKLNQRLSQERAEAIEKYLVSNNSVDPESIKAVGYDYQKPLATNKTAKGRAQNRRVDILISPEKNQTESM